MARKTAPARTETHPSQDQRGQTQEHKSTVTAGGLHRKTVYFTSEEWALIRKACYDADLKYTQLIREAVRARVGLPPALPLKPGRKPDA